MFLLISLHSPTNHPSILPQGCRFVPYTCSETIRHRWYQKGSKYWWNPGFGGLIQGQIYNKEPPRIPREHSKYGYTVRDTPNCPLIPLYPSKQPPLISTRMAPSSPAVSPQDLAAGYAALAAAYAQAAAEEEAEGQVPTVLVEGSWRMEGDEDGGRWLGWEGGVFVLLFLGGGGRKYGTKSKWQQDFMAIYRVPSRRFAHWTAYRWIGIPRRILCTRTYFNSGFLEQMNGGK